MSEEVEFSFPTTKGIEKMHDLLIGLVFVAMILSPCIVAAVGGGKGSTEEGA
jgi:hypothetical protein